MHCARVLTRQVPLCVATRCENSSSKPQQDALEKQDKKQGKQTTLDVLRKKMPSLIPRKGEARFGYDAIDREWEATFADSPSANAVPGTSLGYPNRKGIKYYNPEAPLADFWKEGDKMLMKETKKLWKEIKEMPAIEKPQCLEDNGFLRHNDCRIEYRFNSAEARALWKKGCDSDWHQGFSTCEFVPTDRARSGRLCTEPPKDGRLERAGWAGIRSMLDVKAFARKRYYMRWTNFSHLFIRCRGDGRSYKVMLHAPSHLDLTWFDAWSYPLHTHGGPYWQFERIPFSRFFHTVGGRVQDNQHPVNLNRVSSIGITLMDRVDGDYQLEIDAIGVVHDRSHTETFAYEAYKLPIFFSEGI